MRVPPRTTFISLSRHTKAEYSLRLYTPHTPHTLFRLQRGDRAVGVGGAMGGGGGEGGELHLAEGVLVD